MIPHPSSDEMMFIYRKSKNKNEASAVRSVLLSKLIFAIYVYGLVGDIGPRLA